MMLLVEAIEMFLLALRADGRSEATVESYHRKLDQLVAFLGNIPVAKITVNDLRRYVVHLRNQTTRWSDHPNLEEKEGGLSPFTIHSYITHMKRLFSWLEEEEEIEVNPARRIKNPQPKRREPKAIEMQDLLRLLATTEGESEADLRDRAAILMLADTGCRVGGLCGLQVGDLDLENRLAVVIEKGAQTRKVPFSAPSAEALVNWLKVRPQDQGPWVFVSLGNKAEGQLSPGAVGQMLKRRAQQVGIEGLVNPHSFRHAFAREFLMNGGDLGSLSDLLGHKGVEVTKDFYAIYLFQELQEKHRRHSPVARLFGDGENDS
jgi:site-specific recombinase XerD